jgi:hypothetical protein
MHLARGADVAERVRPRIAPVGSVRHLAHAETVEHDEDDAIKVTVVGHDE